MLYLEKQALHLLQAALPQLRIRAAQAPDGANVEIGMPNGDTLPVDLVWAGSGFPRDVERALRHLPQSMTNPTIVAAKSFSQGARRLVAEPGLSWISADGAANLQLGNVVVERDGFSMPKGEVRPEGGPRWSPAIASVAETILVNHVSANSDPIPLTMELARRSGRSLGSASNALREFDRLGWTTPRSASRGPSARRHLSNPSAMLDSWSAWASAAVRPVHVHSFHRDPEQSAAALRTAFGLRIAFGGRFAASLVAPFSSSVTTLRCYLDGRLDNADDASLLRSAGMTPSPESNRIEVIDNATNIVRDAHVRREFQLASYIRVYADLLRDGVRGEESATHLRDTAIGF
ncbi:hypothetical protein ACPEEZ_00735 [Frigoribacterium sp. 2-23]|uniref:hypothetical protein n=1 Tax=Frigoribacterium sp. 2-23 TaxID=3415006 RepID=UPI003C7028D8